METVPTLKSLPSKLMLAEPFTRFAPPQPQVAPGPEAKIPILPVGVGCPLAPGTVAVMTPLPAMFIAGGLMTALRLEFCITTMLTAEDVTVRLLASPL